MKFTNIKLILNFLSKELNFFEDVFKNHYIFLIWCFLLPIMYVIISIQIFLVIFWFIFYIFLFLIKLIYFKLKLKNINSILYKNVSNYNNNIILIFLKEIFLNLPKKYSFFYFYTLINLILSKQYNYIFKNLKNLKKNFMKFMIILLKLFFFVIIRIITSYSIFILKKTTEISVIIYDLIILKRENFKSFYSAVILNILIKNNMFIDNNINNKKIKFDNTYIYTNPKKILDVSFANAAVNNIVKNTNLITCRYNTSKPFTGISIKTGKMNMNVVVTDKTNFDEIMKDDSPKNLNNEELSPTLNDNNLINKSNNDIFIKHNPILDKIHTKNFYKFSGYTDKDFTYHVEKKTISECDQSESKQIAEQFNEDTAILPIHFVSANEQILLDQTNEIRNLELNKKLSFKLVKTLISNFNKPMYEYKFEDRTNKLVVKKLDYTVRDVLNDKSSDLHNNIKNVVEDIENFYQSNPELFNENNQEILKKVLESDAISLNETLGLMSKLDNKIYNLNLSPDDIDNFKDVVAVVEFFISKFKIF